MVGAVFNLSLSHMLLILVVALIFIGPQQLPEVARTIGRLLNELRRASGDLSQSFWDLKNPSSEALKTQVVEQKPETSTEAPPEMQPKAPSEMQPGTSPTSPA